ncbi:hypothetical protein [Chromohalobacter sp. 48-RD10]|uniref:hypothetical protein n=1 Tax=Chromohalobacter sp. 48-RD10 TaxID=2994063 RepID=UPI002469A6E1|nr:hypothetical protein [Chromohalobacter sp. 48-RD10]
MVLTEYALRSMGFQEIEPDSPLTAHFHHVSVATLVGVTIDHNSIVRRTVTEDFGLPVTVLLGNGLNEMCRFELDDDFVKNEEDWCNKHSVRAPFVMVIVGPTAKHTSTQGKWKQGEEAELVTYETFHAAKSTLRDVTERAAPRIYSSVTVEFSNLGHPVKVNPVTETIAGKLDDGRTVHDLRIEMSGALTVSKSIETSEVEQLLTNSIDRLRDLDPRATGFLHSAEIETDSVRRFLSYFISVEIATHRAFKSTGASSTAILCRDIPPKVSSEGGALLERKYAEFRSLVERFTWCSIVSWSSITDSEISELRRLKKIRDDIAHGNNSDVALSDVEAARLLSLAVLRE